MTTKLEDDLIAVNVDGKMQFRLPGWTPSWARDAFRARVEDSRSIDINELTDGQKIGTGEVYLERKVVVFVPSH